MKLPPQINIIVPLYNEEKVFNELFRRLQQVISNSKLLVSVILIDDGSKDNTPNLIKDACLKDENFKGILLSRNFGHEKALSAGLSLSNATEAVFIIDGDLQDPPELVEEFYEQLQKGYDVVYAVRKKRKENLLKRISYKTFYRILNKISYINIQIDSGDFSMLSTRVVEQFNKMPEDSRFLRGMRSWVGFNQIGFEYERSERHSGESKYTIKGLIKLALNGLFNFSEYPIKFITRLGLITLAVSITYFIYTLIKHYFLGGVPEGFTALFFLITLFGGVQLVAIGIIGEYILRIFFQVKNRPLFIIKEIIENKTIKNG